MKRGDALAGMKSRGSQLVHGHISLVLICIVWKGEWWS